MSNSNVGPSSIPRYASPKRAGPSGPDYPRTQTTSSVSAIDPQPLEENILVTRKYNLDKDRREGKIGAYHDCFFNPDTKINSFNVISGNEIILNNTTKHWNTEEERTKKAAGPGEVDKDVNSLIKTLKKFSSSSQPSSS